MVSIGTIVQSIAPVGKTISGSTNGPIQPVIIPPSNNSYARLRPKKCFRYYQLGHISNQCSKRQIVKLIRTETRGEARDEEEEETRDDILKYEATNTNADEGILLSRSLVI